MTNKRAYADSVVFAAKYTKQTGKPFWVQGVEMWVVKGVSSRDVQVINTKSLKIGKERDSSVYEIISNIKERKLLGYVDGNSVMSAVMHANSNLAAFNEMQKDELDKLVEQVYNNATEVFDTLDNSMVRLSMFE